MDNYTTYKCGGSHFLISMCDLDLELYGHAKVLPISWLIMEICVYMSPKVPAEIRNIT